MSLSVYWHYQGILARAKIEKSRNDVIPDTRLKFDIWLHTFNRPRAFGTVSGPVVAETQKYSENGNTKISVKASKITATSRCQ